jgi:periplasmic protein TonB
MLVHKHRKARLSPNSKFFFQLGLALSLLIIYIALEWKTADRSINELKGLISQSEVVEEIPLTERIIETKPLPPPPPAPDKIEIINDNVSIEETVLETTETNQSQVIVVSEKINITEIVEVEEVPEDVPFAIIEEAPVFPGCKGTKEEKKKCLQEQIQEHVNANFNTGLASELGLPAGKKKVHVQFNIDKEGNITNVAARGPHVRLEKEAARVVEKLPKMIPGKQRGRPVGVKYTLPITLIVEEGT